MDKIYFIVFLSKKSWREGRSVDLVWGWMPTFKEAEEIVLSSNNEGELEYSYDYAVIEESLPGYCHTGITEMGWYRYDRLYNNKGATDSISVKKIDKPDFVSYTVNFSMG